MLKESRHRTGEMEPVKARHRSATTGRLQRRVLLVEDDDDLAGAVVATLESEGYVVSRAGDGGAALQQLAHDSVKPDLILSDSKMRPMGGYELLCELRRDKVAVPFVMMTAYATVTEAVTALQDGACDYLEKPFRADRLLEVVDRHILKVPPGDIIAESAAMKRLLVLAQKVAQTDVSVMLTGPSGSGKEVLARYIHCSSPRVDGPFVAVNCAAIPDSLLEATMMGHERGAFTGAVASSPGKFEQANRGTILLDEITEMPLGLQAKLLRVLQEREVERIGGHKHIALDIRVISTSNRDLREAVSGGKLREDLYYRLSAFPISVPPLADRPGDILPLANAVLSRWRECYGDGPTGFSDAATALLRRYVWPGNVRELENVVQRAVVLTEGTQVSEEALQLTALATDDEAGGDLSCERRRYERAQIAAALTASGGIRNAAAQSLGISPRTLRHKLQQYREQGQPIHVLADDHS